MGSRSSWSNLASFRLVNDPVARSGGDSRLDAGRGRPHRQLAGSGRTLVKAVTTDGSRLGASSESLGQMSRRLRTSRWAGSILGTGRTRRAWHSCGGIRTRSLSWARMIERHLAGRPGVGRAGHRRWLREHATPKSPSLARRVQQRAAGAQVYVPRDAEVPRSARRPTELQRVEDTDGRPDQPHPAGRADGRTDAGRHLTGNTGTSSLRPVTYLITAPGWSADWLGAPLRSSSPMVCQS